MQRMPADPFALQVKPRQGPSLRTYVTIWLVVSAIFAYEYIVLNQRLALPSILRGLHATGINWFGAFPPKRSLDINPGGPLSFRLGWIGFGIICLTNLYILRKRLPTTEGKRDLSGWLNFHIFCGLLGPTLIFFHCNFQVKGLVSISFWSMVVSFTSGIVGRYFYMQIISERSSLGDVLADFNNRFAALSNSARMPKELLQGMKRQALIFAGLTPQIADGSASIATALVSTLAGDIRLLFGNPPTPRGIPSIVRRHLADYARARRRHATLNYFRKLLGYWHAFHMPFAIFMYVVSVIHIASALIFRVNH